MIEVRGLNHTYGESGIRALRDVSFSLSKGDIYGFLGPSGAGKSTAQKLLMGLMPVQTGSVQIQGRPLSEWGSAYKEKIGVAFEFPHFYMNFTAWENIRFYAGLYDQKVEDSTIEEWFERTGLAEHKHNRVSQYSKGMKMRLNFCRAVMHNPDILYLDEPTSGLDPVNSRNIREIIMTLKKQGKTIFLTTHNMEVASELCDKVSFITDGTLVDTDSPESFMIRYGRKQVRAENSRGESAEFPLDTLGNNEKFISWLKENEVKSLHSQEATLEDVFIEITGRSLQ